MVRAKTRRNEKFNITISSQNDATKKPVSFVTRKTTFVLLVVLFVCMVALSAYAGIGAILLSRQQRSETELLRDVIDEQRSLLEQNEAAIEQLKQTQQELEEKLENTSILTDTEEMRTAPVSDALKSIESAEPVRSVKSAGAVKQTLSFESGSVNGSVVLLDWFAGGSEAIPRYSQAVVIDVQTGISFNIRRFGGRYHADCEPLTADDTAIMKEIFGGQWSWERRAIWVKVGDTYYAASMHGMPHMVNPTPANNFNGHFCIHFMHSMVHATNAECPMHQEQILVAFASADLLEEYLMTHQY